MKTNHSLPRLGDLPDEILIHVLKFLPAQRDICALCLVNRRINAIADPCLHKSISFEEPKHHMRFSASLKTRPRRGSLIQSVRLEYPSSELSDIMCLKESPYRVDNFSHIFSAMSNLENLVISVPESLCRGIGTLFSSPFELACLKTCKLVIIISTTKRTSNNILVLTLLSGSLFYLCEDGGYWDLQENIHILSHPTLVKLTIRRAKLDQRGFESLEQPSETPLKELHLVECDLNDDGLSNLLLIPEALQEITITQLQFPSPPLEESPDDIEDYILAMKSAEHSLQIISIDFATLSAENPLKLRGFECLKSLELRDYQLFGQSSGSPRLHSVGLPPNLEVLRFLNLVGEDEELVDLLCYTVENKAILASKLHKIEVINKEYSLLDNLGKACEAVNVCLCLRERREFWNNER